MFSGFVFAEHQGPQIRQIGFSDNISVGQDGQGWIDFQGAAGGLESVEFHVIDGRYSMTELDIGVDKESGKVPFKLECSNFAQEISLSVRIRNVHGIASAPAMLTFQCGRPREYNYQQEQAETISTNQSLKVHFIIIEDGQTSLTEDALELESDYWKTPSLDVVAAIEETVLPGMTGIWDQCGMAVERGEVRVLKQEALSHWQADTGIHLLEPYQGQNAYYIGNVGSPPFSMLHASLKKILRDEGFEMLANEPVIYLVGAQIISVTNHTLNSAEGFSLKTYPPLSVVRWGNAYQMDSGSYMQPRQMVATASHELGHIMGLGHPGEDGLRDVIYDDLNLMKGASVTPNPRANLLEEQCALAADTLTQLTMRAEQMQKQAAAEPTSEIAENVNWLDLNNGDAVSGHVELSIEVANLEQYDVSGFAEFSYSSDDDRWIYIGLDRDTSDGFGAVWDTTALTPGPYKVSVLLRDSDKNTTRAYLELVVE